MFYPLLIKSIIIIIIIIIISFHGYFMIFSLILVHTWIVDAHDNTVL